MKIDYQFNIVILLLLFSLWLCFKTKKFNAQFDELQNVYKITRETCNTKI